MKQAEPQVHEYWPRYWRRTIVLVISMQIIAVLIFGASLLYAELIDPLEPLFWIALIAVLVVGIAINIIVTVIITEPLKQLIAAVAQTAGERTQLLPPNPNAKRYAINGLKPVLQTIYETPLSSNPVPSPTINSSPTSTRFDLAQALAQSNAGVAFFDDDGRILYSNEHVPLKSDEEANELSLEFYTEQSFDDWLKECREKAVHAERIWSRIASKPLGHEGRKIYDVSASYHKASAAPVSMVLIERTEEYSKEDDDLNFIAFAAHELRGPITVIRGYLDTLSEELTPHIDDEQRELFKRLIVSSNRLDSYIKNILNSSKYDRRHFTVRLSEMRIVDIYAAIADDMQLRANAQHRLLSINLTPDLPTVAADASSVSEVLSNLIDNAIKYSNEGGAIEVRAEQQGDYLEVDVQDHGIGMPANVVGNLFHKFYRSHRSRETVAGTGIGLYISKAIVESHGGTMNVRSVEGEGSTFSFTLPIYSSVADKLAHNQGNNESLISTTHEGSWIKNHGTIRG